MNGLLNNARKLLETATDSTEAGLGGGEWTVFVGPEGGLQMIAGGDVPLESLSWSRGALAAWRVSSRGGRTRVEGVSAAERCVLESNVQNGALRRVLSDVRLYEVAAA